MLVDRGRVLVFVCVCVFKKQQEKNVEDSHSTNQLIYNLCRKSSWESSFALQNTTELKRCVYMYIYLFIRNSWTKSINRSSLNELPPQPNFLFPSPIPDYPTLIVCTSKQWPSFHCEELRFGRIWHKKWCVFSERVRPVGMMQKSCAHGCKWWSSWNLYGVELGQFWTITEIQFSAHWRWTWSGGWCDLDCAMGRKVISKGSLKWSWNLKRRARDLGLKRGERRRVWGARTSRLKWLHVRLRWALCENDRCWSDVIRSTVDRQIHQFVLANN